MRPTSLLVLLPLAACHTQPVDTASPAPVGRVATQAAPRDAFAIIDSTGRRIGQVSAIETQSGVHLEVAITGLTPGDHGMHLHAVARCEPPAFSTATGHLNPASRQHGARNPLGAHLGDLPNLVVDQHGLGRASVIVTGVTLQPGATSIGAPGTALVIHAAPDDEVTDPTGNSGARIACAAIILPAGAP
ncbi:MAG: superoxide dismutase family protein [Gemmatimonadota bacterium]|nr:superoxide dismutase family protein [Gemmatimonadota bacterium]